MKILFGILAFFPALPKHSDIFAFRNDAEKHDYYDEYSAFYRHPVRKFSCKKVIVLLVQGTLLFIAFLVLFIGATLILAR